MMQLIAASPMLPFPLPTGVNRTQQRPLKYYQQILTTEQKQLNGGRVAILTNGAIGKS